MQDDLVRELPGQPLPGRIHAVSDSILGLDGGGAGSRVLALALGLHLVDVVAGATTADVVDRGLSRAKALLLLELLVKGEDGTLALLHVAGTATANGIEVGGRGRGELDARGGSGGRVAGSDLRGLDAHGIASTAAARVDVGAADGWVRLGDVEVDHFE